ncbi:waprin-Phi1 isoform X1 [Pogona vitticeps]|nr:WAP four-disulfide core domain protein 3 isoform X1 [Pogona vitticeps]
MKLRKSSNSSSSSCPLCLLSLVGLLVFGTQLLSTSGQNATAATEKAGTCPGNTRGETKSGNCTEECQSDASCTENQKCCPTGCGMSCQVPDEKPGSCPSVMLGGIPQLGICLEMCQSDTQCKGTWKCCRNGCGKNICMEPGP